MERNVARRIMLALEAQGHITKRSRLEIATRPAFLTVIDVIEDDLVLLPWADALAKRDRERLSGKAVASKRLYPEQLFGGAPMKRPRAREAKENH